MSISIYFFCYLFNENIKDLPVINLKNIPYVIFLILIFILNSLFLSLSWHRMLNACNVKSSYIYNATFYHLTQFGKYFPGNFGHFISRTYYSKIVKISRYKMINLIFMESYWLICGASLIFILFDFSLINESYYSSLVNNIYIKLMIILFLILIFLYINNFLVKSFIKIKFFYFNKIFTKAFDAKNTIFILFCYLSYFIISGFILMQIFVELFEYNHFSFLNFVSIISISWVIGFVIPGAPAGLGVREITLISLLTLIMPVSLSISCSIIYRLLSLFTDAILFTISILIKKYQM